VIVEVTEVSTIRDCRSVATFFSNNSDHLELGFLSHVRHLPAAAITVTVARRTNSISVLRLHMDSVDVLSPDDIHQQLF